MRIRKAFLNRKLLLAVLLTIPILMTIGGMRTPNTANLNELRPHIRYCALSEVKQKTVEKRNYEDCHNPEIYLQTVLQNPLLTIRYIPVQFLRPHDKAATLFFPSRAPPVFHA